MSFWERNFVTIGLSTLLAGSIYFGWLVFELIQTGVVPDPKLALVAGYILIQFLVSIVGIFVWEMRSKDPVDADLPLSGMDERDRIINTLTEAGASHVYYFLVFGMVLIWFWHGSTAVLIHTLVAGFFLGDLFRCGLQVFNYNRAI